MICDMSEEGRCGAPGTQVFLVIAAKRQAHSGHCRESEVRVRLPLGAKHVADAPGILALLLTQLGASHRLEAGAALPGATAISAARGHPLRHPQHLPEVLAMATIPIGMRASELGKPPGVRPANSRMG